MKRATLLLGLGLAVAVLLIVAGVAAIYWPAALIVAGIGLGAACLYADDGTGHDLRGGHRR